MKLLAHLEQRHGQSLRALSAHFANTTLYSIQEKQKRPRAKEKIGRGRLSKDNHPRQFSNQHLPLSDPG